MANTTADKLALLQSNKADIKAAIEAMNPTIAPTDVMSNWADSIASIPSGGGEPPEIPTVTYRYDGNYKDFYFTVQQPSDPGITLYMVYVTTTRKGFCMNSSTLTQITPGIEYSYNTWSSYNSGGNAFAIVAEKDGLYSSPLLLFCSNEQCILKGTLITLSDNTTKLVENITYDDELLVWNFDEGHLDKAKPIWIKKPDIANYWFENTLESGKKLYTTGKSATGWGHRMYDMDKNRFVYTTESVSDRIYTLDGPDMHMSCIRHNEPCEFYNIITEGHFNLFANGILTSCSLNNLYTIENMKFVKDDRVMRTMKDYDVSEGMFNGLRLEEQNSDTEKLNKYVKNLEGSSI